MLYEPAGMLLSALGVRRGRTNQRQLLHPPQHCDFENRKNNVIFHWEMMSIQTSLQALFPFSLQLPPAGVVPWRSLWMVLSTISSGGAFQFQLWKF